MRAYGMQSGAMRASDADPVIRAASPNHGPRKGVAAPDMVVLHYTSMASAEAALNWMRDPRSEVSAHYLIGLDGACWSLVDESERAWHAGASQWRGVDDVNSRSIGIELANAGRPETAESTASQDRYHPFPEPQMARLEMLLSDLRRRWPIAAADVVAHSDVAPGRKRDPGEKFDWVRLARRGLAIALEAEDEKSRANDPGDPTEFEAALQDAGYGRWPASSLLDAFRMRHRPSALGRPLEAGDVDRAAAFAAATKANRNDAATPHSRDANLKGER